MARGRYGFRRVRHVRSEHQASSFPDDDSLMAAWRSFKEKGDEATRNQLLEHYLYLVKYNAERIGAKLPDEVDVDDLMSAGVFGLVDAIDAFDLSRGVTSCVRWIGFRGWCGIALTSWTTRPAVSRSSWAGFRPRTRFADGSTCRRRSSSV